jgi:hypothetical protein
MKRKILALILILTMTATMENLHVNISRAAEEDRLGISNGFLLADEWTSATVYVDTNQEEVSRDGDNEYCGLEIIANTFAEDVETSFPPVITPGSVRLLSSAVPTNAVPCTVYFTSPNESVYLPGSIWQMLYQYDILLYTSIPVCWNLTSPSPICQRSLP